MSEVKTAKPLVGEIVHFYDPPLLKRMGFHEGYGRRGIGPYAALVVNDLGTGLELQVFFPQLQPTFTQSKIPEKSEGTEKPYWDWTSAIQKARAQKRLKEDEVDGPTAD